MIVCFVICTGSCTANSSESGQRQEKVFSLFTNLKVNQTHFIVSKTYHLCVLKGQAFIILLSLEFSHSSFNYLCFTSMFVVWYKLNEKLSNKVLKRYTTFSRLASNPYKYLPGKECTSELLLIRPCYYFTVVLGFHNSYAYIVFHLIHGVAMGNAYCHGGVL